MDSGAAKSFMHCKVVHYLNATTMGIPAMSVILADGLFIDCSIAVSLYLKLYGDLHSCSSGVSKTIHVGCHVLCCVLPNLTSGVVLGMDWLHAINPWIDWHAY